MRNLQLVVFCNATDDDCAIRDAPQQETDKGLDPNGLLNRYKSQKHFSVYGSLADLLHDRPCIPSRTRYYSSNTLAVSLPPKGGDTHQGRVLFLRSSANLLGGVGVSGPSGKVPFSKPWLCYTDQVRLLQQRGLVVNDPQTAEQFLSHLNYYRFSGYCLAFESKRHAFISGTTFEQVIAAYDFDLAIRDLLTEALEVVEVELRATIAYHFGQTHGPFGHAHAVNFYANFDHRKWLVKLREDSQRSREIFVDHCKQKYAEFPDMPVWIVTELMSFGMLSQMFSGMDKSDQRSIAGRYGLQATILKSWMHHCVYVRNLCAHHSRLWDKVWAIKPELPRYGGWQPPLLRDNRRLFSTLLLLRRLLRRIPVIQSFAGEWKRRVEGHLNNPPSAERSRERMGLIDNWLQNPEWK